MRKLFNPASPLGRGLAHLYFLDGSSSRFFPDLVSGNHLIGGSTANLSAVEGPYGSGTTTNGTYQQNNLAPMQIGSHGLASADSAKTISMWLSFTGSTAALYSVRNSGGTPVLDLCIGSNGAGGTAGHFVTLTRSNNSELSQIASSIAVNDGNPHCLTWRRTTGKLQTVFVDGVPIASVTDSMTAPITGELQADSAGYIQVGSEYLNSAITPFVGHYHALAIWDVALDDQEIFDIAPTPNVLLRRPYRRRLWQVAGGGGNTDLVADTTAYSLTLNAATLLKGSLLSSNTVSYSLAIQPATLLRGRVLSADTVNYSLTLPDADIASVVAGELVADTVNYSLALNNASLLYGRVQGHSTVAYSLSIQAATLSKGRNLSADSLAYALSLNAATFLRTRVINAETVPYSFNVLAATFEYSGAPISIPSITGGFRRRKKKKEERPYVEVIDYSTVEIPEEVRAMFAQKQEVVEKVAPTRRKVNREWERKKHMQRLREEDEILLMY